MMPSRRRPLTSEERRLWAEVSRSVAPLRGRALPEAPPEMPSESPSKPDAGGKTAGQVRSINTPTSIRPALPGLAPVELKTVRALARGRRIADAVLDLHGMTQAGAHGALIGFLARAQAAGHRIVLVVTGKGGPPDGPGPAERGVLRRMAPHWLALPQARPYVLGWTEAGSRQGGPGALYVRLRRAGSRP
jgi:DNA-nicking Smr family endonuclease